MPILKRSRQKVRMRMQSFPCQKSTQEQGFEGLHQEKKPFLVSVSLRVLQKVFFFDDVSNATRLTVRVIVRIA